MKLISVLLLSSLYDLALSTHNVTYNMGALITCLEQNLENPYGFKESQTWGDLNSTECHEYPELCRVYAEEGKYPGKGDVCDHTDPRSGNVRNCCKLAVMFGEEIDEEKTWSWKCWDLSQCPLTVNNTGVIGCLINHKRIQCCCQDDFCTDDPLYAAFAAYGRPDHYPVDFDALCDLDYGNITVVFDVPGFECSSASSSSSSSEEEEEEEEEASGRSVFGRAQYDTGSVSSVNGVNTADILLIFTYFVVGILSMGVGVFIGTKWKSSVEKQQNMQLNDI